jgi:hypothetical protein
MELQKKIYEEDIETAVEKAVKIFGPQGRLLWNEKGIYYDVVIETNEYGKLWYGDLIADKMESGMLQLEDDLGLKVFASVEE